MAAHTVDFPYRQGHLKARHTSARILPCTASTMHKPNGHTANEAEVTLTAYDAHVLPAHAVVGHGMKAAQLLHLLCIQEHTVHHVCA
eukprot:1315021-Pleurochrysis_carterae.AAC.1